ncbi:MAG: helix-turn-helix domain-containing protein [Blastocatellia bacterium]
MMSTDFIDRPDPQEVASQLERIRALLSAASHLLTEVPPPAQQSGDAAALDFKSEVRRFEVSLIEQALVLTGGHQKKAAKILGLGYTTLNQKIKRYKIRM